MSAKPLIVGLGGTTRAGSTTERCMLASLAHAQTLGCDVLALTGPELPTEVFEPGATHRSPAALKLVDALRRADGLIVASPSYHGLLSGLLKNALDYAEDLRTDARVYLQDRAVGCIVCAEGAQALGSTLVSLRSIIHALRGWPTPFGAAIHTASRPVDAHGNITDPTALRACQTVAEEVVTFARHFKA